MSFHGEQELPVDYMILVIIIWLSLYIIAEIKNSE